MILHLLSLHPLFSHASDSSSVFLSLSVVAPLVNKPIGMATRGAPPPTKTNSSGNSNQSFTPISAITPYASK